MTDLDIHWTSFATVGSRLTWHIYRMTKKLVGFLDVIVTVTKSKHIIGLGNAEIPKNPQVIHFVANLHALFVQLSSKTHTTTKHGICFPSFYNTDMNLNILLNAYPIRQV